MIAGFGGGAGSRSVTLASGQQVLAVCAEERLTRVRGGQAAAIDITDPTLGFLLGRCHGSVSQIDRCLAADMDGERLGDASLERIDHHLAHACTAYLTSPFSSAAVVICDREAPCVTVWMGEGASITPVPWPWRGPGFADLFTRCAHAFGFQSAAADQRFEALARLGPDRRDERVHGVMAFEGDTIRVDDRLEARIHGWLGREPTAGNHASDAHCTALAADLQVRIGELLLELLTLVRQRTGATRVCLGGSFFYHSSMNTVARMSGLFEDVFIPVDPGNSGLSCGAALFGQGTAPMRVSPFLGPHYAPDEIKEVLDNCKLQYSWETESAAIAIAVEALQQGHLVGWFDGAMEWGPRALGARCILANPSAPYVLDNLNRYLKRREPWRGYALSGRASAVAAYFDGPTTAPFMECDYRPREPHRFRHVLPSPEAGVRIHTIDEDTPARFANLVDAVGDATGLPMVVNTSFNGFHEPIVCSPRDAVRVFYGTGVDLLVIDRFVIRK